jgi:hypothetical protein
MNLSLWAFKNLKFKILSVYNNKTWSNVELVGINTTYMYADICNMCREVGSGHSQNLQKWWVSGRRKTWGKFWSGDFNETYHDVEFVCIHVQPWGWIWGHSRNVSWSSIGGHLQNVTCRSWKCVGMNALKFDVCVLQNLRSWTCGHSRRDWNFPRNEKKLVPSSGDSDKCRRRSKRKETSDHTDVPFSTIQAQHRKWMWEDFFNLVIGIQTCEKHCEIHKVEFL